MRNLKKATAAMLCVTMVGAAGMFGCGKQQPAPQPQQQQQQQAEAVTVAPMPAGFSPAEVKDGTLNVSFTAADFTDTEMTVNVYSEDLYDAVEITRLKAGDTVVVNGDSIPVETVEDSKEGMLVNGGFGESENGVTFAPNEGGTYVVRMADDYATYTDLGTATYPVDENCVLNDEALVQYKDGTNKMETIGVAPGAIADYLQHEEKEGNPYFTQRNTQIVVENGKVVEINRHYTP